MQTPDLPDGWQELPLAALGKFHKSRGGTKSDEVEDGLPVVRYGELYTRHHDVVRMFGSFITPEAADAYTPLRIGDVLFAGSGETLEEIGKSAVFLGPEPAYGSGDIVILRPGEGVEPRFLGYATNGPWAVRQKQRMGQGSSIMHIYTHNLEKLRLPLPPLAEQKKIAEILRSVDDAITATKAVIEQTKQVKKGLLQELLTKGIGHTKFKQTPIGEIPESWQVRPLDDLNNTDRPICYGILKPGRGFEGGVPVIKVKNIYDGKIDDTDLLLTDPAIDAQYQRSRLRTGDLLLSIRGTTGRVARVPPHLADANITQDSARIDAVGVDPDFLFFAMQSRGLQKQIQNHTIGQAVKGINIAEVRKLCIPLPPKDEQRRITVAWQTVEATLGAELRRLDGLAAVKAGLLQELLTGKVRV